MIVFIWRSVLNKCTYMYVIYVWLDHKWLQFILVDQFKIADMSQPDWITTIY